MPSHTDSTSPSKATRPNAFDPAFLAQAQSSPEPLTASEANLAGPWKLETVPGHPGCVAVLREWESLDAGDVPAAVFRHRETACALCRAAFSDRPRAALPPGRGAGPGRRPPGGYPVVAVFGEQGPAVSGWLQQFYHPEIVEALGLSEGLVRTPQSLAEVNAAAGGGALAQVGRCLAAHAVE